MALSLRLCRGSRRARPRSRLPSPSWGGRRRVDGGGGFAGCVAAGVAGGPSGLRWRRCRRRWWCVVGGLVAGRKRIVGGLAEAARCRRRGIVPAARLRGRAAAAAATIVVWVGGFACGATASGLRVPPSGTMQLSPPREGASWVWVEAVPGAPPHRFIGLAAWGRVVGRRRRQEGERRCAGGRVGGGGLLSVARTASSSAGASHREAGRSVAAAATGRASVRRSYGGGAAAMGGLRRLSGRRRSRCGAAAGLRANVGAAWRALAGVGSGWRGTSRWSTGLEGLAAAVHGVVAVAAVSCDRWMLLGRGVVGVVAALARHGWWCCRVRLWAVVADWRWRGRQVAGSVDDRAVGHRRCQSGILCFRNLEVARG